MSPRSPSTPLTVLNHAASKTERTLPLMREEPESLARNDTSDFDVPVKRVRKQTRLGVGGWGFWG